MEIAITLDDPRDAVARLRQEFPYLHSARDEVIDLISDQILAQLPADEK